MTSPQPIVQPARKENATAMDLRSTVMLAIAPRKAVIQSEETRIWYLMCPIHDMRGPRTTIPPKTERSRGRKPSRLLPRAHSRAEDVGDLLWPHNEQCDVDDTVRCRDDLEAGETTEITEEPHRYNGLLRCEQCLVQDKRDDSYSTGDQKTQDLGRSPGLSWTSPRDANKKQSETGDQQCHTNPVNVFQLSDLARFLAVKLGIRRRVIVEEPQGCTRDCIKS